MQCRLFFVLIGCIFSQAVFGKIPPDTTSILYKNILSAYEHSFENPDEAMKTAKASLEIALIQKDQHNIAYARETVGWIYQFTGHLDSSVDYLLKAHQFFKENESYFFLLNSDIELSEIYNKQSKFNDALHYLIEGDSISKILNNKRKIADIQRMFAVVYRGLNDNDKAKHYFYEAMAAFLNLGDTIKYAVTSASLAISYRNTERYDSSLMLLQRNLQLVKQKEFPPYQTAMYHEGVAESFLGLSRKETLHNKFTDSALRHYTTAYSIFKNIRDSADVVWEASCIGRTLAQMKRYEEAEKYMLEAYHLSGKMGLSNNQYDIANELFALYEEKGDYKNAFTYLKLATALKDSLLVNEQINVSNELKEKYESEKQKANIALLKKKNQNIQVIYLSAFFIMLSALLLYVLIRSHRSVREEKILNYFATSLFNQNTVEDVFWDIAKNCISKLNLEDCVIYGYDAHRKTLIQKAAYGPKNPKEFEIAHLIEILLNKGIVGTVAQTLKPEINNNTEKDPRYIIDDAKRKSEITVPILVDGKLSGIIDSENSKKGFFTKRHLRILQKIADTCAKKFQNSLLKKSSGASSPATCTMISVPRFQVLTSAAV